MRRHFVERINERSASRQLRRVCLAKTSYTCHACVKSKCTSGLPNTPLARWILGFRDAVLQFLVLLHFLFRLSRISLPAVEICQPEMRLCGERGFLLEFDHSGPGFFGRSGATVEEGGFAERI